MMIVGKKYKIRYRASETQSKYSVLIGTYVDVTVHPIFKDNLYVFDLESNARTTIPIEWFVDAEEMRG